MRVTSSFCGTVLRFLRIASKYCQEACDNSATASTTSSGGEPSQKPCGCCVDALSRNSCAGELCECLDRSCVGLVGYSGASEAAGLETVSPFTSNEAFTKWGRLLAAQHLLKRELTLDKRWKRCEVTLIWQCL